MPMQQATISTLHESILESPEGFMAAQFTWSFIEAYSILRILQ